MIEPAYPLCARFARPPINVCILLRDTGTCFPYTRGHVFSCFLHTDDDIAARLRATRTKLWRISVKVRLQLANDVIDFFFADSRGHTVLAFYYGAMLRSFTFCFAFFFGFTLDFISALHRSRNFAISVAQRVHVLS